MNEFYELHIYAVVDKMLYISAEKLLSFEFTYQFEFEELEVDILAIAETKKQTHGIIKMHNGKEKPCSYRSEMHYTQKIANQIYRWEAY